MDKIFDPFFSTKEPGKGTGLGLSTAHSIIKTHGGFIRVESQPGKGSLFQVYLPAAADNTRWYFASPITNAAVAHLQDDFEVTGYFTGTDYPCEGCEMEGANLKWYLESVKGALSRGYQAMPQFNGTNEENLVPGRGYEAFIWNGEDETLIDVFPTKSIIMDPSFVTEEI